MPLHFDPGASASSSPPPSKTNGPAVLRGVMGPRPKPSARASSVGGDGDGEKLNVKAAMLSPVDGAAVGVNTPALVLRSSLVVSVLGSVTVRRGMAMPARVPAVTVDDAAAVVAVPVVVVVVVGTERTRKGRATSAVGGVRIVPFAGPGPGAAGG